MVINPQKVGDYLEVQGKANYGDAIYIGHEYVYELLHVFLTPEVDDENTPSSTVAYTMLRDDFKIAIMGHNHKAGRNKADQIFVFQGYANLVGLYIYACVEYAEKTLMMHDEMVETIIPHFETLQQEVQANFMMARYKEQHWAIRQMKDIFLDDGRLFISKLREHLFLENSNSSYGIGLKIAHDTFHLYVGMLIEMQQGSFNA